MSAQRKIGSFFTAISKEQHQENVKKEVETITSNDVDVATSVKNKEALSPYASIGISKRLTAPRKASNKSKTPLSELNQADKKVKKPSIDEQDSPSPTENVIKRKSQEKEKEVVETQAKKESSVSPIRQTVSKKKFMIESDDESLDAQSISPPTKRKKSPTPEIEKVASSSVLSPKKISPLKIVKEVLATPEIEAKIEKATVLSPKKSSPSKVIKEVSATPEIEAKVEKATFEQKKPDVIQSSEPKDKQQKMAFSSTASSNVLYEPHKAQYHPIKDASWSKDSKSVPYFALATAFQQIESESSRLRIVEILTNFLHSVILLTPQDLTPVMYLCLNSIAPAYHGIELGVGDQVILKALAESTGRTLKMLKETFKEKGDLGLVAELARSNQRLVMQPAALTIQKVFKELTQVGNMSGSSAQSKKADKIKVLLTAGKPVEVRYLARSLAGKLRIGLAEQSVIQALGHAAFLASLGDQYKPTSKPAIEKYKSEMDRAALIVKTAFCECPNMSKLVDVLLEHGLDELNAKCTIEPGIPIKPMLAHPSSGCRELRRRFENKAVRCEWKYDGERAQIHLLASGDVKVFSRNQEDHTGKYPEMSKLLEGTFQSETVQTFVLDSEVVAVSPNDPDTLLPFQILTTRKRKDATEEDSQKVKVCLFAFDLLFLNGESLVSKSFRERLEVLQTTFQTGSSFKFATAMSVSCDEDSEEQIMDFLQASVKGGCEGLMVKSLDPPHATYEISKRSHSWMKLKKDYLESGGGDSLDLVVLAGFIGTGKRSGIFGGYLLGCYDEESQEYQSICKIGTGFSDSDLKAFDTELRPLGYGSQPNSYVRNAAHLKPDVWFEPKIVWEVKCADLTLSPHYLAGIGLVDDNRGISLRFPRFIRVRPDKQADQATNAAQVAEMYRSQDQMINNDKSNNKNGDQDEDYE